LQSALHFPDIIFKIFFMLRVILLASMGVLFLCVKTSAQRVNTDSLKLISKISDDQLKLGKLQNTVEKKTRNKEDGAVVAQESADKNATAATRLSNNPEDKKDARQADNAAGDAKSDARKARKAADRLDKVNKDIADLQSRIAREQVELSRYTGTTNVVLASAALVQQDSTQHH
jgi:cell division protein FtsL